MAILLWEHFDKPCLFSGTLFSDTAGCLSHKTRGLVNDIILNAQIVLSSLHEIVTETYTDHRAPTN